MTPPPNPVRDPKKPAKKAEIIKMMVNVNIVILYFLLAKVQQIILSLYTFE